MNPQREEKISAPVPADRAAPGMTIPELVGKVYEAAPPTWRCRMLEHLIRPLGALALVGVCNGIFTKIWFRSGMQDLTIRLEDTETVRSIDVVSLASYVQQASADTISGLASLLATSPMTVYSAAAAMLVSLLVQRDRRRSARGDGGDPPESKDLPG